MDLTLIPFALRDLDGAFVEVAEVSRGRACGCICPSCRTPLIARRGNVKAWHFAHASRGTYASTADECAYSFFVSVRLMARQLLGASWRVHLPEFNGSIAVRDDQHSPKRRMSSRITDARQALVEDIAIEATFGDTVVDAVGRVGDVPFVVYFTHPSRPVPTELKAGAAAHGRCGVLTIALDPLLETFARHLKEATGTMREMLTRFLADDVDSKAWCFHPRQAAALERALAQAAYLRETATVQATPVAGMTGHDDRRPARYECVMCKVDWVADEYTRQCPKCGEVLFARQFNDHADGSY